MPTPSGHPAPALSVDVADLAWGPVTVRIAWTLLSMTVAPRAEILRDVRDHVWLHLDPDLSVSAAEDVAERLTRAFVTRARGKQLDDPWPQDNDTPLSPRWRSRLTGSLAPLAAWVLRLHYADGVELPRVALRTGEDVLAVEAAREGLREVVRRAASDDGVPVDGWSEARLDRLIHRLACMAADGGPPLLEVAAGQHPDWTQHCVRAARAWTLVDRGFIDRRELIPPSKGGRPRDTARVVVLQLQREARALRRTLARELNAVAVPMGDDLLLVDGADLERLREVLVLAAEVGMPDRDQLRGAVIEGPGRWSRHGLLGPLAQRIEGAIRAVSWGTVDGLGELPAQLPEPPSARGVWAAVAALGLVAAGVVWAALQPVVPPAVHPLQAEASPGRGGVWLRFDVDEDAYVLVVREREGELDVVLESNHPADKIRLAVGDGSYLTHMRAEGVLVASSSGRFAGLGELVAAARTRSDPLDALADAIDEDLPGTDVWTWEP